MRRRRACCDEGFTSIETSHLTFDETSQAHARLLELRNKLLVPTSHTIDL